MGKIYVGQTDLTIRIATGIVLHNILNAKIMYKKPNGTEGNFLATVVDEDRGIIQYAVTSANDIDMQGTWTFWVKITDDQGLISIGEPNTHVVNLEGY